MKEMGRTSRSRLVKVMGSALAAVLLGTLVSGSGTQAASRPTAVKTVLVIRRKNADCLLRLCTIKDNTGRLLMITQRNI